MANDDRAAVEALVARLEAAWNAADPTAFAAEFTPGADFVNVRGDYASGSDVIAQAHAVIWKGIYAGSTIRYSLSRLRPLGSGMLLAHLDAHLRVPAGPLAGEISAIPSLVLVDDDGAWRIAAFHNTARAKA